MLALAVIFTTMPTLSLQAMSESVNAVLTTDFSKDDSNNGDKVVLDSVKRPVLMASPSSDEVIVPSNPDDTITRAQWLHNLVVIFDIVVEVESLPDNYFSDIDSKHEYYQDVLLAVEYGIVDIPAGEQLCPDDAVTREFAASTLNFCLGYNFDEEITYTFSDVDDCIDADSAQVAIDRGWFEVVEGAFAPQNVITAVEIDGMLADVEKVLADQTVDENYDSTYNFADGVIVVEKGTVVTESAEGIVTITDCPTEINDGDKFAVFYGDIPSVYTAQMVQTVDNTLLIATEKVDSNDAFTSIDAQGKVDASSMEIIPAEGFDVSFGEENSGVSTYAIKKIPTIESKGEIEVIPGVTLDLTVEIENPEVEYIIKNDYVYAAIQGDTEITYNIVADLTEGFLKDTTIPIFECTVFGVGSFTVSVKFELEGKISGCVEGELVVGMEYVNGNKIRAIKTFNQKRTSTNIEATATIGVEVKFGITRLPLVEAYVYAEVGVEGHVKLTMYASGKPETCTDCRAFLYLKYGAVAGIGFGDFKKSTELRCDIFDEDNSPVKIVYHYEDGKPVSVCTRDGEELKYFTTVTSKQSGSGWSGANGAYGLNDDGSSVALFSYKVVDGGAQITKYNGNAWTVNIPNEIDGYKVKSIGKEAFKNASMRSVTMPDTVTSIGEKAFYGCSSLKNITLSKKLTSIGSLAFAYTAIESIFIPKSLTDCGTYYYDYYRGPFAYNDYLTKAEFEEGTKTIPKYVLASTAIEDVIIPDSVTTINANAFVNCANLEAIDLSTSLKTIGDNAFKHCVSLTEIVLPDSVTTVDQEAFYECTSLENVQLSNNLTSIGSLAFAYTTIESIFIPKSLTDCESYYYDYYRGPFAYNNYLTKAEFENGTVNIPKYVLGGCNNLEQVYIPETVKTIGASAFVACDITDVWFGGSEEDRNEIIINANNTVLSEATWHYNSCNIELDHEHDNACDAECNNCGKIREVPDHVYDDKDDLICNECFAERPAYTPGDLSDDDKINNKDLGLLMQYLNGWDVKINEEAADVNGDGKVNNKDYGLLMQYLNGWDVEFK